jgi:shikimate dehydrogenase
MANTEIGTDPADTPDEPVPSVPRKLAVLGSPIAHSKSPLLHRAAYAALGLDWEYEAVDVTSDSLPGFIGSRGPEWLGLSLTMPLKQAVLPLLASADQIVAQTGAANTVLLEAAEPVAAGVGNPLSEEVSAERGYNARGFNTDVSGMVRALAAAGLDSARFVHILGGGATASSALSAAAMLGAERVLLSVRSIERSAWLEPLAHSLGLIIDIRPLRIADRTVDIPDLVVSTLPGGTTADVLFTDSTRRRAVLLDVAYEPWPSALAQAWGDVNGTVVSGLSMLAHQALLQVRVFVLGDPLGPLENEEAVLAAMLEAVGLDRSGHPVDQTEHSAVPES